MTDDFTATAVIYVRVSSDKQVTQGNGLHSQETRCRAFCVSKKYYVAKVFSDGGVSGKLYERPAYLEMLNFIDTQNDKVVVVCDNIDRLSRDVEAGNKIIRDIESRGSKLEGPTFKYENTPEGNAMYNMQLLLGQYHREANARQVKDKTRARMQNGYRTVGGCVVGYRPTEERGIHEPYEPVAGIVKEILEGYATGRFNSYTDMARHLNGFNFPRRKDEHRKEKSLKTQRKHIRLNGEKVKIQILGNAPYYAGYIENDALEVTRRKGHHQAIISVKTMTDIEKRLRGEKLPVYRKNLNQHFPLKNFIKCSECDSPMKASFCGGRHKEYGYYYCYAPDCSLKNKNIRYETVHKQFVGLLKQVTPKQEIFNLTLDTLKKVWKEEETKAANLQKHDEKEIIKIENQIQTVTDEYLSTSNKDIKKILEKRISDLTTQKDVLKERQPDKMFDKANFDIVLNIMESILSEPLKVWEEGDLDKKQLIQRLVFPNGLIYAQTEKKFRKPGQTLVYLLSGESKAEKRRMVDQEGFEPPTNPL